MSQQAASDRIVGVGLLSSMIAGIIAGICARIIMRIVALTAHIPPGFTVATFNIIFLGLIIGLGAGFVYSLSLVAFSNSPRLRKHLPGPIWRGLVFGSIMLVIVGLPSLLIPLLPREDLSLGMPLLNKFMFATLPLIFGIALGGAEILLDRYLPGKPSPMKTDIASSPPHVEE